MQKDFLFLHVQNNLKQQFFLKSNEISVIMNIKKLFAYSNIFLNQLFDI